MQFAQGERSVAPEQRQARPGATTSRSAASASWTIGTIGATVGGRGPTAPPGGDGWPEPVVYGAGSLERGAPTLRSRSTTSSIECRRARSTAARRSRSSATSLDVADPGGHAGHSPWIVVEPTWRRGQGAVGSARARAARRGQERSLRHAVTSLRSTAVSGTARSERVDLGAEAPQRCGVCPPARPRHQPPHPPSPSRHRPPNRRRFGAVTTAKGWGGAGGLAGTGGTGSEWWVGVGVGSGSGSGSGGRGGVGSGSDQRGGGVRGGSAVVAGGRGSSRCSRRNASKASPRSSAVGRPSSARRSNSRSSIRTKASACGSDATARSWRSCQRATSGRDPRAASGSRARARDGAADAAVDLGCWALPR